ncbi:unnamed protein product [Penicillium salamii]|nr:unnamed protein product [Penicillium salamii]CAG8390002.1 unnamed protein product [Penicillium salamii]
MPSHRRKDGPAQRRRDGCSECRRKKVKCDLQKPVCTRCIRFPRLCKYDINMVSQNLATQVQPAVTEHLPVLQLHQALNTLPTQPVLCLSPLLSSKESRFFMHIFSIETAPRLFPAASPLFLQRLIAGSLETPHLLYAILASACSHHSRLIKDTGASSKLACLKFTNLSISSLRSTLSDRDATLTAETVTTAMALCTNDVCNGNMQSWRTHLGGVMRLFAAFLESQGQLCVDDPYVQCLAKWFTTMDVIAGLSGQSDSEVLSSENGVFDKVFIHLDAHVDDICGYSLKLAPLLVRLSQLVQRQHQISPEMFDKVIVESQALELEILALVDCSVPENQHHDELRNTHLAFVYSALLHLHRRVQLVPKDHGIVKKDLSNILKAVKNIPPFSFANILILWPVFSAGSETDDTEERKFIHTRMGDMQSHGLGNFTRARELLSKFWAANTPMPWDNYFANLGLELVLF